MGIIDWIVNLGEFITFFSTGLAFICLVVAIVVGLIIAVF